MEQVFKVILIDNMKELYQLLIKMIRDDYRREQKNNHGYRRSNFNSDIRTFQTKNIVYQINPVGLGQIINLYQKAKIIIGQKNIFNQTQNSQNRDFKRLEMNPLFKFVIKMCVLYASMSYNCQENQLKKSFFIQFSTGMKKQESKLMINQLNQCLEQAFPKGKKSSWALLHQKREQRLRAYKKKIDEEVEKIVKNALIFNAKIVEGYDIPESHKSLLIDQKYIRNQINQLRNLEPLTVAQQVLKCKLYQKKHELFFNSEFSHAQFLFKLKKISTQSEPVVQILSDFVELRYERQDYQKETLLLIRDIYNEIKAYDDKVISSINRKESFMDLSPESVVIDQLALKPSLYFEPSLLDALGLRWRPCSTQCRILFYPTPKGIDYFRSSVELEEETQLILRDPYFGCIQMYLKEGQSLKADQKQEIDRQKKKLHSLKQAMLTWRFLLLAYFINHNRQFGRLLGPVSQEQALSHFKQKLKQKQEKIRNNAEHLQQFLGFSQSLNNGEKFDFNFSDLGEYLSANKDDSTIQSHCYYRLQKYANFRWALVKQAIFLINHKQIFTKLINVKKYLIMFLVTTVEIVDQSRRLIEYEHERAGERKKIRNILKEFVKKIKADKKDKSDTPEDNVRQYFQKFRDYLKRDNHDTGRIYLSEDREYIFKIIQKIHEQLITLKDFNQKLNEYEQRGIIRQRSSYNQMLNKTKKIADDNAIYVSTFLKEIILVEIDQKQESLHKLSNRKSQTKEILLQINKRLILIIYTLLTLNENNYSLYESLVVPLLNLVQNPQASIILSKTKAEINAQQKRLAIVEEIIEYKKNVPQKISILKEQKI